MSCDPEHLVRQLERFLFETHAIASLLVQGVWPRRTSARSSGGHPTNASRFQLAYSGRTFWVRRPTLDEGGRCTDTRCVTMDDDTVGHVVEENGDYLIVEHGQLLKTQARACRRRSQTSTTTKEVVRTTLSKRADRRLAKGDTATGTRVAIARALRARRGDVRWPADDGDR